MHKNFKKLKRILATTSAISLVGLCAAQDATAAWHTDAPAGGFGGVYDLATGAGLDGGALNDGDGLRITNAFAGNTGKNTKNIAAISVEVSNPLLQIRVSDATSPAQIGSVANKGGVVIFDFNVAGTLQLTGTGLSDKTQTVGVNDYTGIRHFDLGGVAGTLDISSANKQAITLTQGFFNAGNATLLVNTPLIANSYTAGDFANTQIAAGQSFTIDTDNNTSIRNVTFADAASTLTLSSTKGAIRTFTVQNDIDPGVGGAGIIELLVNNDNSGLILDGNGGAKILGKNNKLNNLKVTNNNATPATNSITITGSIDLTGVNNLNIGEKATLLVKTSTIGSVPTTTIGGAGNASTLIVNAGDVTHSKNVVFANNDSVYRFVASGGNKTLTLNSNFVSSGDLQGILELNSAAGSSVAVAGAKTIGESSSKRIKELRITGNDVSNVGVSVYAGAINLQDNTSTIASGANDIIFQVGSIKASNPSTGTIKIQNTNVQINGSIGSSGNSVGNMSLAANSSTTCTGSSFYIDNITMDKGGQLTFNDPVDTINAVINGVADNNGILYFKNKAPVAFTGSIGGFKHVNQVHVAGSDVSISGDLRTDDIMFDSSAASLSVDGSVTLVKNTGSGGIATTSNFGNSLVLGGGNFQIDNSIGDSAHGVKVFLTKDNVATINSTTAYASFITKAGSGSVNFTKDGAMSYDLMGNWSFDSSGLETAYTTSSTWLNQINFTESATVKGSAAARNIIVAANKTASFAGTLGKSIDLGLIDSRFTGQTMQLNGVIFSSGITTNTGSTVVIGSGSLLAAPISPISNDAGTVAILGNVAIAKDIGNFTNKAHTVEVSSGSRILLGASSYNSDIFNLNSNSSMAVIASGQTIYNPKGTNTTIDLGTNNLIFRGNAQFTGAFNLSAQSSSSELGQLILDGATTVLDLSGADLNISFTADTPDSGGLPRTLIVRQNPNAKITGPKSTKTVNITESNPHINWTYNPTTFTFTPEIVGTSIVVNPGTSEVAQTDNSIANLISGDDKVIATQRLTSSTAEGTTESVADFFTEVTESVVSSALRVVDRRLTNLENATNSLAPASSIKTTPSSNPKAAPAGKSGGRGKAPVEAEAEGLAAGDDSARYGLWATPFYGQARQGNRSNVSGYKSRSIGATVGFDTLANDDLILGAAFTLANLKLEHKGVKSGDTTRITSKLVSLYGLQQLPHNFFVQAIGSFGSSDVTSHEARIIASSTGSAVTQTATANYNSSNFSIEAMGGYNYRLNQKTIVTALVGLDYSKTADEGYKETGTSFSNYTVAKKSKDKLSLLFGGRLSFSGTVGDVDVSPEWHFLVDHDLNAKPIKIDARLDGQTTSGVSTSRKPAKTMFNAGMSISAGYHMMEYSLGYDSYVSSKYVGHQGTTKLRIDF